MSRLRLTVLVLIASLLSCQGQQGLNGTPGVGSVGPAGERGPAGTDAVPVTVVRLCPGTPSYPSVFIEVAFCVDGTLYGTYSTNGGFSTEFLPGSYYSNGVGSSCNFAVQPNCVIQPL